LIRKIAATRIAIVVELPKPATAETAIACSLA